MLCGGLNKEYCVDCTEMYVVEKTFDFVAAHMDMDEMGDFVISASGWNIEHTSPRGNLRERMPSWNRKMIIDLLTNFITQECSFRRRIKLGKVEFGACYGRSTEGQVLVACQGKLVAS